MNLPNGLTIFRIIALPFCAWALLKENGNDPTWQWIAWTSFFLVGLTDILDGRIARRRNQVSQLGIILDPIADKAFIATALIGLSFLEKIHWWVTLLILIREVGVTFLRFAVLKREVISASQGGKVKTLLQNFSVGLYILPLPTFLYLPRDILLAIAIILTLYTGFDYFRNALRK